MGIRRIQVQREADMPSNVAATPGGTIFGTTPGGSKIIYDRLYLLKVRDSPASHTPPTALPQIPGVTCPKTTSEKIPEEPETGGAGDAKTQNAPANEEAADDLGMEL